jgi:hypothetical protein
MDIGGMQFDDLSSISNNLPNMLGTPGPEAASIRLGIAVSGGLGTGLAVVNVGSSLVNATVGCVCTLPHIAGERVVLATQGPMLICLGALVRAPDYASGLNTTSSTANLTVLLPAGRFSAAPQVIATVRSNAFAATKAIWLYVGNESTASFTVFATVATSGTFTVSGVAVPFSWLAVNG